MKKIYRVIKNGTVVYTGGYPTAHNKYNHLVAEDWKDEDNITLLDEHGNAIEEHSGE